MDIEQNKLKEYCGSQDQIWASFGGFKIINFLPNGTFKLLSAKLSKSRKKKLEENLLLMFTGYQRYSKNIEKQKQTRGAKRILGILVRTASTFLDAPIAPIQQCHPARRAHRPTRYERKRTNRLDSAAAFRAPRPSSDYVQAKVQKPNGLRSGNSRAALIVRLGVCQKGGFRLRCAPKV